MWPPRGYERLPKWSQKVVDQIGHVGIGGGPAALVGGLCLLGLSSGVSGAIGAAVGVLAMGAYELAQNLGDRDNDYADMALDLSVGITSALVVGGLIAGFG